MLDGQINWHPRLDWVHRYVSLAARGQSEKRRRLNLWKAKRSKISQNCDPGLAWASAGSPRSAHSTLPTLGYPWWHQRYNIPNINHIQNRLRDHPYIFFHLYGSTRTVNASLQRYLASGYWKHRNAARWPSSCLKCDSCAREWSLPENAQARPACRTLRRRLLVQPCKSRRAGKLSAAVWEWSMYEGSSGPTRERTTACRCSFSSYLYLMRPFWPYLSLKGCPGPSECSHSSIQLSEAFPSDFSIQICLPIIILYQ